MERVWLPLEAGRCAPATGVRGAAHAAARLADVVRGAQPRGGPGLAPAVAAARAGRDARGDRPARRRPVSGRPTALRAARLLPLPFQHAARAGHERRVVAAGARGRPDQAALAGGSCDAPLTSPPRGLSSRLLKKGILK